MGANRRGCGLHSAASVYPEPGPSKRSRATKANATPVSSGANTKRDTKHSRHEEIDRSGLGKLCIDSILKKQTNKTKKKPIMMLI